MPKTKQETDAMKEFFKDEIRKKIVSFAGYGLPKEVIAAVLEDHRDCVAKHGVEVYRFGS